LFIIPSYGNVGIFSLLYVCLFFVCLFFVRFTYLSAAGKDSGVKLGMLVRLLSGQVFSHFGELWLAWSHGGGITSEMSYIKIVEGQSKVGAVAR